MKKNFDISKIRKAIERKNAMADGFYDGRFRPKVVKDKKKELSKRGCKEWCSS